MCGTLERSAVPRLFRDSFESRLQQDRYREKRSSRTPDARHHFCSTRVTSAMRSRQRTDSRDRQPRRGFRDTCGRPRNPRAIRAQARFRMLSNTNTKSAGEHG